MSDEKNSSLKKELKLFDIYAISTGAMFSSGFFLLPGLAAAQAGPSAFLAYFLAGILILPAMLSQAELCTAMPRAGGSYFFLDRAMGPLMGTIGGLGTYMGLVLKTGFALLGIGVYLAIYMDIPIKPVAIGLVFAFAVLNVIGFGKLLLTEQEPSITTRMSPFMPFGVEGLISTVALVFVSYAGLTKVASVAEEVKNPERDIPLGMMLSLATTSVIYVAGVALVIAVIPAEQLHADLAPIATATEIILPGVWSKVAVGAVVVAAIAAFASTGNAGLMASSRYPLAMARDKLMPQALGKVSKQGTPIRAIVITSLLMAVAILFLSEGNIAKLASAFQLLVFGLICLAVIVMRESGITSYDPGFKSPLYPWMQIAGIIASIVLLLAMNYLIILLTSIIVGLCVAWYILYAKKHVNREGALLHWFAKLGMQRFDGLDVELRQIIKEKGIRNQDVVKSVMNGAIVLDLSQEEASSFEKVADMVSKELAERLDCEPKLLDEAFIECTQLGITPVGNGIGLPHAHIDGIPCPCLAAVRVKDGLRIISETKEENVVNAFFFLVSPKQDPQQHLRLLAHIAVMAEDRAFMAAWLDARNTQSLHELLMWGNEFKALRVDDAGPLGNYIGASHVDLMLPETIELSFIRRQGRVMIPDNNFKFETGDILILNGEPDDIKNWLEELEEAEAD